MGEHFDLYFAGWYNDDMMQIIIDNEVSKDIKDYYNQRLEKANFTQRQKIIDEALKEGLIIIDNS